MEEAVSKEAKPLTTLKIVLESLQILIKNLEMFMAITIFTILPFSLLLFGFALASQHLNAQITTKEILSTRATTKFEARHVTEELKSDYLTLLKLKSLYFLPCYVFSLLATITAITSTSLALTGKPPTCCAALTAVRRKWKRALVTSLYVYLVQSAYDHLSRVSCVLVASSARANWVVVLGPAFEGFEFYLTAVLSLAMVVSVLEEEFGWEAIAAGWELIDGKRFTGWVLAGFQVLTSAGIGWVFNVAMGVKRMGRWVCLFDGCLVVCLFCMLVLLSYVVNTIFYFECKRNHDRISNLFG